MITPAVVLDFVQQTINRTNILEFCLHLPSSAFKVRHISKNSLSNGTSGSLYDRVRPLLE